MATLEEIEKRRAARRDQYEQLKAAQEAADLEAIDAIEVAYGYPLSTMTANGFKPGAAVRVAFRAPTEDEYKRFGDMVGRAQQDKDPAGRRKAQEMLAATCTVYPDPGSGLYKATIAAYSGLLISVALEAAKAGELRAENEGKG